MMAPPLSNEESSPMISELAPKKFSISGSMMAGSAIVVVMERKKPCVTAFSREDRESMRDIRVCHYPILYNEWWHPKEEFLQNDF
jgi:hypothetical protein